MNLGQEIQSVLVTGGTGFVGGAVAQRLRAENCIVMLIRKYLPQEEAAGGVGNVTP